LEVLRRMSRGSHVLHSKKPLTIAVLFCSWGREEGRAERA
jgi:hypothetical protein